MSFSRCVDEMLPDSRHLAADSDERVRNADYETTSAVTSEFQSDEKKTGKKWPSNNDLSTFMLS
jgi:hypothetical protein